GGTDFSASIIANCLNAKEVWYMKEVNGIMSADPKMVKEAYTVSNLTYKEAAELSFFGAKILHPMAIRPLQEKKIPARFKNVADFDNAGTLVADIADSGPEEAKAVTCVRNVCIVSVQSCGMTKDAGIPGRVLSVIAKAGIDILIISQSGSDEKISLAIRKENAGLLMELIHEEFELEILKNIVFCDQHPAYSAIVSVIGSGIMNIPGLSGALLKALEDKRIGVHLMSYTSSGYNISFVVDESKSKNAVCSLHETLMLHNKVEILQ
ncbi:hypothetical protein ACFL67_04450, partial [candidate division KSB1 bacterium]